MEEEKRHRKKRGPGRPKKRGPKKKRKSRAKKPPKKYCVWDYKILSFLNGRQIGYHGKFHKSEQAYEKIRELLSASDSVVFPKQINNNEVIENSKYEYLLLEKNRYGDKESIEARNDFGKIVKQVLSTNKWVVLDKFKYNVEETFWVWGFNPNTERKTFGWIYDNIISYGLETSYDMKRVFLYKNKIVVKDDSNKIELIICKTMGDAIRFYNMIDKWNKERKNKQIFMSGSANIPGDKKRLIEKDIMELTGWPIEKVQQSASKKHKKV